MANPLHIRGRSDIGVDAIMERIKVPLRMSEDLRERLKVEAKHSVRSLNGEIIHRFASVTQADRPPRLRRPGEAMNAPTPAPTMNELSTVKRRRPRYSRMPAAGAKGSRIVIF